jgi:hypothetical protein
MEQRSVGNMIPDGAKAGDVKRQSKSLLNRRPNYKSGRLARKDDDEEDTYLLNDASDQEDRILGIGNEFELRDRLRTRPKKSAKPYYDDVKKSANNFTEFIIRPIEPGDTLQNLALKCGCSVFELKTANNLITEQDFYGLKNVKIPVKKYGILSEVLSHQLNSSNGHRAPDLLTGNDQLDQISCELPHSSSRASPSLIVNVGLKRTFGLDEDKTDVKKFMQNLDKDLEDIRKVATNVSTSYTSTELSTDVELFNEALVPNKRSAYYCDGADCGLSLWHVLVLAVIVVILIPVIYTLMVEEEIQIDATNHSLHHHHHI